MQMNFNANEFQCKIINWREEKKSQREKLSTWTMNWNVFEVEIKIKTNKKTVIRFEMRKKCEKLKHRQFVNEIVAQKHEWT